MMARVTTVQWQALTGTSMVRLGAWWRWVHPTWVDAVSADRISSLSVTAEAVGDAAVLTAGGVLDSTTYRSLRDKIIKAALDEPSVVIVDVAGLVVPADSAWVVFTSARLHVTGRWPEIPILLVCNDSAGRRAIAGNGVTRYVPVYPTIESALSAVSDADQARYRRRARTELAADTSSLAQSRDFVAEWLTTWAQADYIPVAKVVVTTFVENVLKHTESAPNVRLESDGVNVTVAVEDASPTPAAVREESAFEEAPSGLRIVSALCRMWANAPTPSGKTVWAVIGPENRL